MASFSDLQIFIAIVDAGSLTGAARMLGRSLQSVSRSLASLETEHRTRLISRTTRTMKVTPAGKRYYERIKPALLDIEAAQQELFHDGVALSGRLRVAASTVFGATTLTPLIAVFLSRHPAVEIELRLDDKPVDLVMDSIDLAIRSGDMPDSNLIARKVGLLQRVFAASPSYLAVHGTPESPHDLANHNCVSRDNEGEPEIWQFRAAGQNLDVAVRGRFRSDNAAARLAAIVAGAGIGRVTLDQIKPLIETGQVQRLLQGFEIGSVPVSLVWISGAPINARLRALIDFLAQRLSGDLS